MATHTLTSARTHRALDLLPSEPANGLPRGPHTDHDELGAIAHDAAQTSSPQIAPGIAVRPEAGLLEIREIGIRVARAGRGKSAGYRTVVAADLRSRCVFLFGFAKSERDDLDQDELRSFKELARPYLGYGEETIDSLLAAGELMEVESGQSQTS